jgi:hypothetical protein
VVKWLIFVSLACMLPLQVSRSLRTLPYVEPTLPTLALVGAPNVGKSSLVRLLSSGVPEVSRRGKAAWPLWVVHCCCAAMQQVEVSTASYGVKQPVVSIGPQQPCRGGLSSRSGSMKVAIGLGALVLLCSPICSMQQRDTLCKAHQAHSVALNHINQMRVCLRLYCAAGVQLPLHHTQHQDGPLLHRCQQAPGVWTC